MIDAEAISLFLLKFTIIWNRIDPYMYVSICRQHRSMSSSEDEMPSTSDGHSGEELLPRADTEISSEKGSCGNSFTICYAFGDRSQRIQIFKRRSFN